MKNYIQDIFNPRSWQMFGETGVVAKYVTNNWFPYAPVDERQSSSGFESSLCVTFSGLNCLEMKLNYYLKNNLIPAEALKFFNDNGYIVNGVFDFNEVFSANQNGATPQGMPMADFWESIRKVGAIPQYKWTSFDQLVEKRDWNEIRKPIPQELLDLGKEFLKYVTITYDWVVQGTTNDSALLQAIGTSPLQVAVPVCYPWVGANTVNKCELVQATHAVVLGDSANRIFDTYDPFIKTLGPGYPIQWAIRHQIEFTAKKGKYTPFTTTLSIGQRGADIVQLQMILKDEGLFTLEPTGYYGAVTAKAVLAYQIRYNIQSYWTVIFYGGKRCGLNTIADLNTRWCENTPQWNTKEGAWKLSREIMSTYGLTDDEKNLLCAVIKAESGFNINAINKNTNGSFDYGICQINDKWWIGEGKYFASKEEIYAQPEKSIKFMCEQYKAGNLKWWYAFTNQSYKKYL